MKVDSKKIFIIFLICLFVLLFFLKNKTSLFSQERLSESSDGCISEITDIAEEENTSLYFGNPSGADKNPEILENFLIQKKAFSLSYNSKTLIPNWVAWHLDSSDIGDSGRADNFRPDGELPSDYYAVKKNDYQYTKYGFDRGHVCPSADRTSNDELNGETFYMTNMIPQAPDLNRIVWKELEAFERSLALSQKELYIYAGPAGVGGTSGTGSWNEIALLTKGLENGKKIQVPAYCWKIILILNEGQDDFSRVNSETQVLAVYMPNVQGLQEKGSWEEYLCTVDFIEEETGYDFFAGLSDDIENIIESKVYQSR